MPQSPKPKAQKNTVFALVRNFSQLSGNRTGLFPAAVLEIPGKGCEYG
jgi:hypothetical protein